METEQKKLFPNCAWLSKQTQKQKYNQDAELIIWKRGWAKKCEAYSKVLILHTLEWNGEIYGKFLRKVMLISVCTVLQ
jgi:hypothetical protein